MGDADTEEVLQARDVALPTLIGGVDFEQGTKVHHAAYRLTFMCILRGNPPNQVLASVGTVFEASGLLTYDEVYGIVDKACRFVGLPVEGVG